MKHTFDIWWPCSRRWFALALDALAAEHYKHCVLIHHHPKGWLYLKHLIIEHHRLFKELYPSNNLISKHFMVHYPRCIQKIGPLIHIWTMRFEAKHTFFQDCVKNLKNVTVSLAKKHQFAVAYHWECLTSKAVESGPGNLCLLETLEFTEDISAYL